MLVLQHIKECLKPLKLSLILCTWSLFDFKLHSLAYLFEENIKCCAIEAEEKKAQHSVRYEPTTSWSRGLRSTYVIQPL